MVHLKGPPPHCQQNGISTKYLPNDIQPFIKFVLQSIRNSLVRSLSFTFYTFEQFNGSKIILICDAMRYIYNIKYWFDIVFTFLFIVLFHLFTFVCERKWVCVCFPKRAHDNTMHLTFLFPPDNFIQRIYGIRQPFCRNFTWKFHLSGDECTTHTHNEQRAIEMVRWWILSDSYSRTIE